MTNSTWTENHIQTLLTTGRDSILASILLMDQTTEKKARERGDQVETRVCKVVYPPCDTRSLVKSSLGNRRRGLTVSLAQFRPEKDQAKQLYALAKLFELHPGYTIGTNRVVLTLMGGVRDEADQSRLEALNTLANELGVQDNVEFVVNAPYSEIVQRLSIGLNTMQDEHFGINVVEFMAPGLIPIVHASGGPKMDIVTPYTPYNRRQNGYHAKTPEEFAGAIHTALSLPEAEHKYKGICEKSSQRETLTGEVRTGVERDLKGYTTTDK